MFNKGNLYTKATIELHQLPGYRLMFGECSYIMTTYLLHILFNQYLYTHTHEDVGHIISCDHVIDSTLLRMTKWMAACAMNK